MLAVYEFGVFIGWKPKKNKKKAPKYVHLYYCTKKEEFGTENKILVELELRFPEMKAITALFKSEAIIRWYKGRVLFDFRICIW